MTITVTGATGFVGRQVVRTLVERGYRLRIILRDPLKLGDLRASSAVELIQCADIFGERPEALQEMLAGSSTLIHAAWYVEPAKYLDSPLNLDCLAGTLRLARAFATAGGRRFVGVGTCAEYDLSAGVLRTDSPLAPNTLYATCKASAYQVLSRFFIAEGVSFAWCRLFYLYGEGEDERRLVPYIRKQLAAGEEALLTRGDQIRDFVDVQEAGRMIAGVALGKRNGPVNVCSGRPVTVRQLAEHIAAEFGRLDLLRFGARPENAFDPPLIVGVCEVGDDLQ